MNPRTQGSPVTRTTANLLTKPRVIQKSGGTDCCDAGPHVGAFWCESGRLLTVRYYKHEQNWRHPLSLCPPCSYSVVKQDALLIVQEYACARVGLCAKHPGCYISRTHGESMDTLLCSAGHMFIAVHGTIDAGDNAVIAIVTNEPRVSDSDVARVYCCYLLHRGVRLHLRSNVLMSATITWHHVFRETRSQELSCDDIDRVLEAFRLLLRRSEITGDSLARVQRRALNEVLDAMADVRTDPAVVVRAIIAEITKISPLDLIATRAPASAAYRSIDLGGRSLVNETYIGRRSANSSRRSDSLSSRQQRSSATSRADADDNWRRR